MNAYKIGLDFGTHQTKICLEDSSDKRNKRYFFHRFTDLEGNDHWTIPSIVQVNNDKTLSYGFTDLKDALYREHGPGDPPIKPKEPEYMQYRQFDFKPLIKPVEPRPFVFRDFSSLPEEERKIAERKQLKKKKRYDKNRWDEYEKVLQRYNSICQKRESEIEKDRKEVDSHNAKIRAKYEKALSRYEQDFREYYSPHPEVFRNFKQAVFSIGYWPYQDVTAEMVSVWYLSSIFFDIEKEYGKELVVCMGTSSGRLSWEKNKQKASQIMLAVYDLVENVCKNDKQYFLSLSIDELISHTQILPFSQQEKEDNSIFVFPEAFANINPLAQQRRFGIGINAIIDIGGGTTDISIFSAYEDSKYGNTGDIRVDIYDYISIPYGVNAIEKYGIEEHFRQVGKSIDHITSNLQNYARSLGVSTTESKVITNFRPVVFSGGGSLRGELCKVYGGFSEIIHISKDVLIDTLIDDLGKVSSSIAMLNTALGLAKCQEDDSKIPLQSYDDLFSKVKEAYKDKQREYNIIHHYEHGLSDD